ncbi:MAG: ABC transporter permease [Chloroflexi bacterium]|nr:ABC transporter permease [Chloroflexota bacterium]MBV9596948.1 ABC transporter permease [Chloroflexota bacterium]
MTAETRAYIARRVLLLVPLLVGLTLIVFTLIHLAPGDPAAAFVSEQNLDPQVLAQIRKNLGLDQPLPVQYVIWISHVARLDFGTAYTFNQKPVIELIAERLPATLVLQSLALIVSLAIAIPLGVISAKKQYSILDTTATTGAFLGLALPSFWIALMLQLFIAVNLGWLPVSTPGVDESGPGRIKFLVLPLIVLALPTVAVFLRFVRSSMLEVIRQDYLTAARAKGLSDATVTYRHALKNALIPIVTVTGTQLARLLGGAVIVEYIFAWPGLGALAFDSVLHRDYPVVLALTLLTGAFILVVNLIVDIAYTFADPRLSFRS